MICLLVTGVVKKNLDGHLMELLQRIFKHQKVNRMTFKFFKNHEILRG